MVGEQIYTKADVENAARIQRAIQYVIGVRDEVNSLRHTLMCLDSNRVNIAQTFLTRMEVHLIDIDNDMYTLRQVLEDRWSEIMDKEAQKAPQRDNDNGEDLEDDSDD